MPVARYLRKACWLFTTCYLASCAGLIWKDSGHPGPLIEGNQRPNAVYSCDEVSLAIADSKYCETAFVDHHGRKLDVYELGELIRTYRPNVPALATYKGATSYRYYLLTIAPVVVMAVPVVRGGSRVSCIGSLDQGCLHDNTAPLNFRDRPDVLANSFWFSPDLKIPGRSIEDGAQTVVIPLGSSKLELISDGKSWDVRRNSTQ